MIVDASAVLAILFNEPDAGRFAAALVRPGTRAMSAVNWFEAAIAIDRRGDSSAAADFSELIRNGAIEIVAYSPEQAGIARQAYDTWGKRRHPAGLNMSDCAAYALARLTHSPLLFKGRDFTQTDIEPALKD